MNAGKISISMEIFFLLNFSELDQFIEFRFPVFSPEIQLKFGSEIRIALIRFVGLSLCCRSSHTKSDCCLFFRSPL